MTEDVVDLLRLILREFNTDGPWTTLEVNIEGQVHTAVVDVELDELLTRASELVYESE